jgi:hypothetical protein
LTFLELALEATNLQNSGNFLKYKTYYGIDQYLDDITTAAFVMLDPQSSRRNAETWTLPCLEKREPRVSQSASQSFGDITM